MLATLCIDWHSQDSTNLLELAVVVSLVINWYWYSLLGLAVGLRMVWCSIPFCVVFQRVVVEL